MLYVFGFLLISLDIFFLFCFPQISLIFAECFLLYPLRRSAKLAHSWGGSAGQLLLPFNDIVICFCQL